MKQLLVNRFKQFSQNPKQSEATASDKQVKAIKKKLKFPGVDSIMNLPAIPPLRG